MGPLSPAPRLLLKRRRKNLSFHHFFDCRGILGGLEQYQGGPRWCLAPEQHSRRSAKKLCQMLAASALAHSWEHLSREEFYPVPTVTHSYLTPGRHYRWKTRGETHMAGGGEHGAESYSWTSMPTATDERNSSHLAAMTPKQIPYTGHPKTVWSHSCWQNWAWAPQKGEGCCGSCPWLPCRAPASVPSVMGIGLLLLGQPAPETLADNSSAQGKPIKSQRPPLPLQEGLHMLHHIHLSASHRDREPRSLQYGTLC